MHPSPTTPTEDAITPLGEPAQFAFSAFNYAPVASLPLEVFVHLLVLLLTLIRRAGINRDLVPLPRTVRANISAAGDLYHTAREYFVGGVVRKLVILIVILDLYPPSHNGTLIHTTES